MLQIGLSNGVAIVRNTEMTSVIDLRNLDVFLETVNTLLIFDMTCAPFVVWIWKYKMGSTVGSLSVESP